MKMGKSNRNFVAREMASNARFKSKRFSNDRSNRRSNDSRNNEVRNFILGLDENAENDEVIIEDDPYEYEDLFDDEDYRWSY
jgi:hypothetical protein